MNLRLITFADSHNSIRTQSAAAIRWSLWAGKGCVDPNWGQLESIELPLNSHYITVSVAGWPAFPLITQYKCISLAFPSSPRLPQCPQATSSSWILPFRNQATFPFSRNSSPSWPGGYQPRPPSQRAAYVLVASPGSGSPLTIFLRADTELLLSGTFAHQCLLLTAASDPQRDDVAAAGPSDPPAARCHHLNSQELQSFWS